MLSTLNTGWLPAPATVATVNAAEAKARLFIQRGRRTMKRLSLPGFSWAGDVSWDMTSSAVNLLSKPSCVSSTERSCSWTYLQKRTCVNTSLHTAQQQQSTQGRIQHM